MSLSNEKHLVSSSCLKPCFFVSSSSYKKSKVKAIFFFVSCNNAEKVEGRNTYCTKVASLRGKEERPGSLK